eukprot:COSAG02_NODE_5884_length_3965_cov_1.644077_3_plen_49_part_00
MTSAPVIDRAIPSPQTGSNINDLESGPVGGALAFSERALRRMAMPRMG